MHSKVIGSVAVSTLLLATAALGTVASAHGVVRHAAPSGTLKVGLDQTNVTFDPALSHAVEDGQVEDQIYNTLIGTTTTEKLVPELATRWTVSPNGMVYTFFLRHGVSFSDGTPFNAQAVQFELDRVLNPATASPRASLLGPVNKVEVVNPYEVKILMKTPYAPLLDNLTGFDMPSPTAVKKWGKAFGQHPVGTGPYVLKSWIAGGNVTLAANPHYWQAGEPKIGTVVFIPIVNSQSMITALNTGEIQIADTVDPSVIGQLSSSVAHIDRNPGLGFFMLNLNETKAPLNNVHARRAIQYALDRNVINHVVFNGQATPGYSELSPESWAYDKNLKVPFSDALAKAQLKAAGMPKGFSITLQVQNSPSFITFGQVVAAELGKVGIKVTIQTLDYATYLTNLNSGNYQMDYVNDSGAIDPDGFYIFNEGSVQILKDGFNSAAVNKLMNEGRTVTNKLRRKGIYEQVAKDMLSAVPMVFLENPPVLEGVANSVKGFTAFPLANQFYLASVSLSH